MQVASIFLHNMRTQPCPAWGFGGSNWTTELKQKVNNIFSKYLEYEQFPSFNYWIILTDGENWVTASRFTWDSGCIGGNWEKLAQDLENYYKE